MLVLYNKKTGTRVKNLEQSTMRGHLMSCTFGIIMDYQRLAVVFKAHKA